MNTFFNSPNQSIWNDLFSLSKTVDKQKKKALSRRIADKPQATDLEYLLGAFIQMYAPFLEDIIHRLSEKGYAIDAQSGFSGKNGEYQVMTGDFSIDYVTRNKLEKIGVKYREHNGSKSLLFWPEKANLSDIKAKWEQIINALPDKGKLTSPSTSSAAISFRRKFVPKAPHLQRQRLFESLKFKTQNKIGSEMKRRKVKNPRPNKLESILGLFIEELEPQVRQAVINMNKKGYSTDVSGFMDNPCDQMIEGDFQINEKTKTALEAFGVLVETNPSGYTRLQFSPQEADLSKIKKKWNKIVSLLPEIKQTASTSMTRKARDFRIAYQ